MQNLNKVIKNKSPLIYFFSILFLSFFLFGTFLSCSKARLAIRTRAAFGGKFLVKVNISENANLNSPVALDLLVVYDKGLLDELLGLSSKKWFEKREQIKLDHLKGEDLDYWGWEWVPGQKVSEQKIPLKPRAEGGLIFARYLSPGTHRVRINPFKDISVHLLENGFSVEPVD